MIMRGLDVRVAAVASIKGSARFYAAYSPEFVDAEVKSLARVGLPRRFTGRDLRVVRFAVDLERDRWRVDAVEVLGGSPDDWGMWFTPAHRNWPAGAAGKGQEGGLTSTTPGVLPTAISVCNGKEHLIHLLHLGVGRRMPLGPGQYVAWPSLRSVLQRSGLYYGTRPLQQSFRALFTGEGNVRVSIERLDGEACYKVVSRRNTKDTTSESAMWVAPLKGYALLRAEQFVARRDNPKSGWRYVNMFRRLQDAGDGLWLPLDSERYAYDYATQRQQSWSSAERCSFNALQANTQLDDTLFAYHLPLCTVVTSSQGIEADPVLPFNPGKLVDEAKFGALAPPADDPWRKPLTGGELPDPAGGK